MNNPTTGQSKEKQLSWEDLVRLEPRLDEVRREIELVKDDNPSTTFFCANGTWKRQFQPRMYKLVGWGRKEGDPQLRTSEAYRVAHWKLYNLLPDCRNCLCLRIEDIIGPSPRNRGNR